MKLKSIKSISSPFAMFFGKKPRHEKCHCPKTMALSVSVSKKLFIILTRWETD